MAIIRRVWGPFAPEAQVIGQTTYQLHWSFFGIRDDMTMAHWTLVFETEKRKFRVNNNPLDVLRAIPYQRRLSLPGLTTPIAHPNAFLDDRPVEQGRIVDILKSRLRPEDFARCTALAIARKG